MTALGGPFFPSDRIEAPRVTGMHLIRDLMPVVADRAVDTLAQLVRIPSVTGSEGAAQQWVTALMTEAGLDVDVFLPEQPTTGTPAAVVAMTDRETAARPNVVGCWKGTGGGRSLIINGHIDVVDPGTPDQWRHDPWTADVVDGRLYGRGACDAKAGLVAALCAVTELRRAGIQLRGDLVLQSVVGEEEGGIGTYGALLRGYRADAAVVLEPSRLAIVPAATGIAIFRLTINGLSAHASMRQQGVSALEKFVDILDALRDLETEVNREIDHALFRRYTLPAPLNIHHVLAGGQHSMVPDRLVAEGRYGYFGCTAAEAQRRFAEKLASAVAKDPWLAEHPPRVSWLGASEPSEAPRYLVDELVHAYHSATGREPIVEGVPYGSDARILTQVGRIPTVLFGPGDIALAHVPDEYVPLDEYLAAIHILAAFVVQWCGVE